ncbi:MAG: tRNA (adenosine(37)-N6)-dimethylallyltransferase MiaA [Alphaproteobacteria bacterium]|nr:tRNA (adenosine(37)-N6)-dimethylallyltransferase MiaA [Alphaproteobacteria bacterium]
MTSDILILTGTTCSGKSALALELAATRPAVIINADAMQMYRELRIITARPTAEEEAQTEHALYGVLDATTNGSVKLWLEMVLPVIAHARAESRLPVLVGGTGMYLKALMEGINDIPPIPDDVRAAVRSTENIYDALQAKDPVMAARLKPGDTQRILRALEVMEATGESLASFQEKPTTPPLPDARFHVCFVDKPRAEIYARIDARFLQMMEQGALEEVRALMEMRLPESQPLMRAHGVPELIRYLQGTMTQEEAVAKGQQNTRNYAKRQITWLRNQFPSAQAIDKYEQFGRIFT